MWRSRLELVVSQGKNFAGCTFFTEEEKCYQLKLPVFLMSFSLAAPSKYCTPEH